MKLKSIELRDFRCFASAVIDDLGPLNFFGGKNYSGKSTILDAIAFALTGTCRGAEGGRGLTELRRTGSRSKATVAVEWEDGVSFSRKEDEGPRASVQAANNAYLGVPPAIVRSCLYAGEILRLDRKEAQALLMGLLPKGEVVLPDDLRRVLAARLGFKGASADLPTIERLYDQAYAARADAGRLLKSLGTLGAAPPRPEWLAKDDDPVSVRNGVGRKLGELRAELSDKQAAVKSRAAHVAEAERKLAQATAARDEVDADLKKLRQPAEIAIAATNLFQEKKEAEALNREVEEKRTRLGREYAEARAVAEMKRGLVSAFGKLGSECPTCFTKLTVAGKKSMAADLESKARSAADAAQKIKLDLDAVSEPKSLGAIERKIADLEGEEQRYARLVERKRLIAETVAACKAILEESDPGTDDLGPLCERIAKGEARVGDLIRYDGALSAWSRTKAEIETTTTVREQLDFLCTELGPEGIRTKLTQGAGFDTFQKTINESLSAFGMSVDFGPLLRVEDDPHINGRPARMLSESEGILFSLAFACAVAAFTNFGIVCVDRWDALDSESTAKAGAILAAHDALQRFVFLTPKQPFDAFQSVAEEQNRFGRSVYVIHRGASGSTVVKPVGVTMTDRIERQGE